MVILAGCSGSGTVHSRKIVPQESCRSTACVTQDFAGLCCDFLSIPDSVTSLSVGSPCYFSSADFFSTEYIKARGEVNATS